MTRSKTVALLAEMPDLFEVSSSHHFSLGFDDLFVDYLSDHKFDLDLVQRVVA